MTTLHTTYRRLNPFVNSSVGENEIWGGENGDFCDVESIHASAFDALWQDIEQVNVDHETRARFLVGAAGTGKSHLFARLRRKMSHGQFTFVSNPPTDHWAIKRYILSKVMSGMRRPLLTASGPSPYSQLQRIVYKLLQRISRYPGLPVDHIHRAWAGVPREDYYPTEEELFTNRLENVAEMDIPLHVRRVLFRALDEEKRSLAVSWLSGSQVLTDNDHEQLGVNGPLEGQEITDVLKWLGSLSIGTGPIVLVLDQLDGLRRDVQIWEIESLMIDLKDSARNWFLIVSLVVEKFDLWNRKLSHAFRSRFGSGEPTQLEMSGLSGLTAEHARELLLKRLSSPALHTQRQRDGIGDQYYPMPQETVEALSESGASSPRTLLQRAADAYVESVSGIQLPRRDLSAFLEDTFFDIRDQLSEDDLTVDTNVTADRIRELFSLACLAHTGTELEPETGPLHSEMQNFRGSDRFYECNGATIRVVGHDVQQTSAFPALLRRIVGEPSQTMLVRDGRIPATGRATVGLLNEFQQDKVFFHLPLEEIKNLHALGALLAKMSEGDFEHERTDPEPTEENIVRYLGRQRALVNMDLAQHFVRLTGLEKDEETKPDSDSDETDAPGSEDETTSEPPPTQPPGMIQVITQIMERERWLAFERLCVRITSAGMTVSPAQIHDCLRASPLCESLSVYPMNPGPSEGPRIIVYSAEV